jgi:1-acyl-sn-glycerol-3-phosphate acyltransferase
VICRFPGHVEHFGQAVYIGNHQNTYDMFTISCMVPPCTVTIGKRSLLWIPLFGPLYWLSGNILLNRRKHSQAYSTITQVVRQLKMTQKSVWIFPEGTRSRGRGLLPFKTGAFHTAIAAGVPIIPICASNLHHKVHWNRRHNGSVIVEMLAPISTQGYGKHQARELADYCYQLMQAKMTQLEAEIAQRDGTALLNSTSRENG